MRELHAGTKQRQHMSAIEAPPRRGNGAVPLSAIPLAQPGYPLVKTKCSSIFALTSSMWVQYLLKPPL